MRNTKVGGWPQVVCSHNLLKGTGRLIRQTPLDLMVAYS